MAKNISGAELELTGADAELLNTVISLDPALQATAYALKLRVEHNEQCSYPITAREDLFEAFDGDELHLNGHLITLDAIEEYVDEHLLPINNDRELASAVYLAFLRCSTEFSWAQQAPTHAHKLLDRVSKVHGGNLSQHAERH